MPVIPVLRRLRQNCCEFEARLGYLERPCFKKQKSKTKQKARRRLQEGWIASIQGRGKVRQWAEGLHSFPTCTQREGRPTAERQGSCQRQVSPVGGHGPLRAWPGPQTWAGVEDSTGARRGSGHRFGCSWSWARGRTAQDSERLRQEDCKSELAWATEQDPVSK